MSATGLRRADLRCAPWTRAEGVDPIGSAGTYDAFVLVELPLPWPNDVSEHAVIGPAAVRDKRVRVLAVAPPGDRTDGRSGVTVWRRERANRMRGTDHDVGPAELGAVLERLVEDPTGSPSTEVGDAPRELLVCTHGRRDACCGRWGTLLHVEVAARWSGVRVRRCSHTGGHRFAPTGITFPDGRAWAYLDTDVLDRILDRSLPPASLRPHDRGSTGFDRWAQVVDARLLGALGWTWLDAAVTRVTVDVAPDRRSAKVDLAWRGPDGATGSARAAVEVGREVPVMVCGEPPEAATKTSEELVLRDFSLAGGS